MRKPVVLKGPGTTAEDYAREVGMPPERQAMIREILADHGYINRPNGNHNGRQATKSKKKIAFRKKLN